MQRAWQYATTKPGKGRDSLSYLLLVAAQQNGQEQVTVRTPEEAGATAAMSVDKPSWRDPLLRLTVGTAGACTARTTDTAVLICQTATLGDCQDTCDVCNPKRGR